MDLNLDSNNSGNENLIENKNYKKKFSFAQKIPIYNKYHKLFSFILVILVTIAISRISFIGGTFLDSFVFGLAFGYLRYAFYGWVYLNFFCKLFNFKFVYYLEKIKNYFFFFLLIASAWVFAIYYPINSSSPYSFGHTWTFFGDQLKLAWNNVTKIETSSYKDIPTGVVGCAIVSIFFLIPSAFAAQSIFWIVTLVVFISITGYYFLNDFLFILKIFDFSKEIFRIMLKTIYKNTYYKLRLKLAKNFTNSNLENETFAQHNPDISFFNKISNQKIEITRGDKKIMDTVAIQDITDTIVTQTQEIFKKTALKKYYEKKAQETTNEYKINENTINVKSKVNNENVSADSFPQDVPPQNLYYEELLFKKLKSLAFNQKRINPKYLFFDINDMTFGDNHNNNELNYFIDDVKEKISNFFLNLNITFRVIDTIINNEIIRFSLLISNEINVEQLDKYKNDLQNSLKVVIIRIFIISHDDNTIGIEINNPYNSLLTFDKLYRTVQATYSSLKNHIVIGQTDDDNVFVKHLNDLPHLLIAGNVGFGPAIELHTILLSLLLNTKPNELNLMLIDTKKNQFNLYKRLPHLIVPIINDTIKALIILNKLINEMINRYKVLQHFNCKNIYEYNLLQQKEKCKFSQIVIAINDIEDLLFEDKKSFEKIIVQISQLSKVVGVHLILLTQKPSTNVITPLINANISTKLAFSCVTEIELEIILGVSVNANDFKENEAIFSDNKKLIKLQVPLIDEENIRKVCNFIRTQQQPVYDENLFNILSSHLENLNINSLDVNTLEFYNRIKRFCESQTYISAPKLARSFNISYEKAVQFMDLLMKDKIISEEDNYKNLHKILINKNDQTEPLMKKFVNNFKESFNPLNDDDNLKTTKQKNTNETELKTENLDNDNLSKENIEIIENDNENDLLTDSNKNPLDSDWK